MKVLISGSTGLIGSALTEALLAEGADVRRLVRSRCPADARDVGWDPVGGHMDAGRLEGMDAVVHLAGENIASGRWTLEKKRRIRDSRVNGTSLLCRLLAGLAQRPRVLVSASATGYYGDRGDEVLTEESSPGRGFLPEVCVEWEDATRPAADAGVRVVRLRTGVVLAAEGGALTKMLPVFRMGVAGRIGDGRQWMSWIGLDDVVGIIRLALEDERLAGPVNAVAPEPVTNAEFTRALGGALHRPTALPAPAFAARLAFGQMADDLLLASTRVVPRRAEEAGYDFRHARLEDCLRDSLS